MIVCVVTSMLQNSVLLPKTKSARFLLALFICAVTPAVILYGQAILQSLAGGANDLCDPVIETCSPFLDAKISFVVFYVLITIPAFGLPILVPALMLWAVFEFANYLLLRRKAQLVSR
jgi:hypothetical protein